MARFIAVFAQRMWQVLFGYFFEVVFVLEEGVGTCTQRSVKVAKTVLETMNVLCLVRAQCAAFH